MWCNIKKENKNRKVWLKISEQTEIWNPILEFFDKKIELKYFHYKNLRLRKSFSLKLNTKIPF